MPNILDGEFYAGISGLDLGFDRLDLGDGLHLAKTKASFLTSYFVIFEKEKDNEKELEAQSIGEKKEVDVTAETEFVSGQEEISLTAELYVPAEFMQNSKEDRLFLVRWIIALLRIWSSPAASIPVLSNATFSSRQNDYKKGRLLVPFETQKRGIFLKSTGGSEQTIDRLSWVGKTWKPGLQLIDNHRELRLAIEALDQVHFVQDYALGILLVWSAMEELFSPSRNELRFRISALLSAFLEPFGPERRVLQKQIAKLYDARSTAAHGRSAIDADILVESIVLLRKIIIKMLSDSSVPSKEDLEARLFGG